MNNELRYLVSDYFATGEGRCISMMITRPQFEKEDYESNPNWYTDENGQWIYEEGTLKSGVSDTVVLTRAFVKEYGEWYGRGIEILSREEFLKRFSSCVPEFVKNITDENEQPAPWFEWKQQIYFNYS